MEKRIGYFSPDFSGHTCELYADGDHNQIKHFSGNEKELVSVTDLLCTSYKQLLFCPVSLNCGHVYCRTCIIPADEKLRCQVCQCLHPKGSQKVCLTLDQFLAAKFPKEYTLKRDAVQLKQVSSKQERETPCSLGAGKQNFSPLRLPSRDHPSFSVEPGTYVHIGVGCDTCGMYPILGDRYKCKDCTEIIGFDLCGECYNTGCTLPGRFNQRHTPQHKFELIKGDIVRRLRLTTEQLDIGSTSFVMSNDALENLENEPGFRTLSGDSEDNTSSDLSSPFFHVDSVDDEDDTVTTD